MLIKCPECGHEVSDRARICPHCGIDIAGNVGNYDLKPEIPMILDDSEEEKKQPKKKSRKGFWTAIIIGFVLALVLVLLGIYYIHQSERDNEQRAFENAIVSTEPAVLQNFLDIYPDAQQAHRDSIMVRLEELKKVDLDWENAVRSLSKSALQLFIVRNPGNVHIPEAQLIIDSLDYDAACHLNTMESYKHYMDSHEQGGYYDLAANAYDSLRVVAEAQRRQAEQDSIAAAQQNSLLDMAE